VSRQDSVQAGQPRQPAVPRPPGADVGYVLTSEWHMSVAVAGGTQYGGDHPAG
jgi:hypothetical protein